MAGASAKRTLQAHGLHSKVYGPILRHIFTARWRKGAATVLFTLDDIRNAAEALGLEVRNPADLVYRMRSRTILPKEILDKGFFILRAIGRGQYQFEKGSSTLFEPLDSVPIQALDVGVELFCGCGGLSTGFLDAGLQVAAGFDIDRRSIEAYEYNHSYRGSRGFVADLSCTSGEELLKRAGIPRVDFLIGGPPCQPFSIVGKRLGSGDERSGLVADFLRFAKELNPAALFFENVPNLAAIDGGAHLDLLVAGLEALQYSVVADVIPAADFGVPQVRRRLLLMAMKGTPTVRLPPVTHGASVEGLMPYVTAHQALGDLPIAGDYGESGVFNHEPTEHSPDMLARFATLRVGERERRSFHDRLHPDRPGYTLRAGTGNFSPLRPIHYRFDRVITVRESARLQGFTDTFIWPDWIPRLQQYRQVGNAVPPPVACAVAKSMAEQLGWQLDQTRFRGDPATRPPAITMSDEERRARRRSRIRGASLGKAESKA